MRLVSRCVVSLLLPVAALPVVPAAAQQFEGLVTIISYQLSADAVAAQARPGESDAQLRGRLFQLSPAQLIPFEVTADTQVMQMKRGILRSAAMEVPMMGTAYMLMDVAGGMLRTVVPARQGYFEVSLRGTPAQAGEDEEEEDLEVTPLGRTQMINGMRCTGYRVTQGDTEGQVWTTMDPTLRALMLAFTGSAGEAEHAATQGRAFLERYGAPVMSQEFDDEGGFTLTLWTLQPRTVPDSLFVLPSAFRRLDPGQ